MSLRDSRLWQNHIAHSKLFIGDEAECMKWYGMAMQKLGFMLKTNPGATSTTLRPSEDVVIKIDTRPNRIAIEASSGLYLESGFINFRNTAPCNIDTYKPSLLYYSNSMKSYLGSLKNPIDGKVHAISIPPFFKGEKLNERESKVTTCSDKYKVRSLTLCDITYKDQYPIFCDTDEIRRLKSLQQKILPSNFSGKLRLFVQGMYGKPNRNDYSTIEDYPALCYPLYVGTMQLGYDIKYHQVSSGLFTTPDNEYFIINISASSIWSAKLEIKGKAANLLSALKLHKSSMQPDNVKRIEAYILGGAEIMPETKVSVDLSALQGDPLAYGWHFNWDGSEAHIITHHDNLPTDQYWYANHYKLTFTHNQGVITASLTTLSSNDKWNAVGNKIVFTPEYFSGNMQAFVNPMKSPFVSWDGEVNSDYEADIYCFYDENQTLQKLTIGNAYKSSYSVGDEYYTICGIQSGEKPTYRGGGTIPASMTSWMSFTSGSSYNYSTEAAFNSQTIDFYKYNGTTDYEAPYPYGIAEFPSGTIRRLRDDTSSLMCGGLTQEAFAGYPYLDGVTSYLPETIVYEGITYNLALTFNSIHNKVDRYISTGATETKNVMHVAIIPIYDCSSAFIAQKEYRHYYETGRTQITKNAFTRALDIFVKWFRWGGGIDDRVLIDIEGPLAADGTRGFGGDLGDGAITPKDEYTGTVSFSNSKGIIFEDSFSGYDNLGLYGTYFDVNYVTDPTGYFTAASKTSIMGDKWELITGLVENEDGYIHHTSVGWA